MFAIQPRIFHRGLILLAVPLLFEVLVAAALIYLQHYLGEAVEAEAHRKRVIFHTNELWCHNMQVTTTHLCSSFLRNYELNPLPAQRLAREYAILTDLVRDEPRQLEQLENIMRLSDRCKALCGKLRPAFSESGGRLGQILALKQNLLVGKPLAEADIATGLAIRSFREYELQQSAKAAEKVRLFALLIQLVAAGAVIGSTVIAYFLFRYFMRDIHKGIHALTKNIQRFKEGLQLEPAVQGTDEIALLNERFHEMADEVAAAHRVKHAFLTTMSREIGAPINTAKAYLTSLSSGSLGEVPDRARNRIAQADQILDRIIRLVNDLLELQDPTGSRMAIVPRACSLEDVIQTSIDSVAAFAEKHGVIIESTATHAVAFCDPDRIAQVLVNLLSNAIKFSASGSSVVVTTLQLDSHVEVRVTDTGRGIPTDMIDAVFERFQQVATTDATEKGGTGLGLPICKKIIERHNGSIGVESEVGKGSTFWFRLPVSDVSKE
ncbi:MAG TPA: HAMP domain-containing sensor histidine kinase [Candidatus Obscuribacterales bacterium]